MFKVADKNTGVFGWPNYAIYSIVFSICPALIKLTILPPLKILKTGGQETELNCLFG